MLRGQEKVVAQTTNLEPYIPGEEARQWGTQDGIEEFPLIEDRPDQVLRISASLPSAEKEDLKALLREYSRVFAWTVEDMPRISTDLAVHHLNVDPRFKPVKQKKRSFAPERNEVIKKEVDKLLESKIILEVYYPTWLANPVLVKKEDESWRMCVDFTDLNKACPKDCFPLPRIDGLVDSSVGFDVLCFLNAFKGYHQIEMAEENREKTSFITEEGTYCYRTMPFGLKNAGATYQRLVNKLFQNQIGRSMEIYVDDMLVKSRTDRQLVPDLRESLNILWENRMRLNSKKCTFGVRSGRFLGFLISREGIRANPDKFQAIMGMAPPRNIKKKAFIDLKAYLAELPTLTAPEQGEPLFLYLSACNEAVSAVLVREDQGAQRPIYYVSRALQGPETQYTPTEKLVLALVHAARKLRPYFQTHSIVVMTDQPLRQILTKSEISGRMTKWAVELAEHDISYQPRTAIKAQALADFLAEGTSLSAAESSPLPEECVTPEKGDYVLREVHEGLCTTHVGSRVLAKKCLLLGYYWPSVFRDVAALVQQCRACQVHVPLRHQSTQEMIPIHSPWPFAQWGIDLLGPFPRVSGRYGHLVVAIDDFTKWMEAEPLATIFGRAVQKFFWKNIVCRFGIPHVLISDNGRQFSENPFRSWCAELGISQHFISVDHPQTNGQVENVNRTILQGLKTRLELAQSSWLEELPSVLWAYRTTPRTATHETPFSLTYGTEAVVPAEIGLPSPRTQNFVVAANDEELRCNLDMLEAKREEAAIRMAECKSQLARYHNVRVRNTQYQPGDLVLRKNLVSRVHSSNKLDPNWEGPYKVLEASQVGYCKLAKLNGVEVPRTWHFLNLRLFIG
nr:uncharacterized protein K02A2.6-like [Coffea arabica]